MSTAGQEDHAAASATKFAEQRAARRAPTSRGGTARRRRAAAPPRSRTRCRTRRCRARPRRSPGAARTSWRGRRRTGRAGPSLRTLSRRHDTGFQPICGTFRPRLQRLDRPLAAGRCPPRRPARSSSSNSSCMPMHRPITGHPRGHPLAQQLVESERAHVLHRLRHRPDAGQHDAVGLAHARVVSGQLGLGAHVLERLVDRAQVAHPVVEDRDVGAHSRPLVEGTPWHARVLGDRLAQRPRERLERHLDHVVRVGARLARAGAASAWRRWPPRGRTPRPGRCRSRPTRSAGKSPSKTQ